MVHRIIQTFKALQAEGKPRLDVFLAKRLDHTRSSIQKMVKEGLVFVNGKPPKKSGDTLRAGDIVEVREKATVSAQPQETISDVPIIAETDDYLVVNKPAGLLVHQTEANEPVTLANWLLARYPALAEVGDDPKRPGIVHRLDREASGLLAIAKTQAMFEHLKAQFQHRTIEKEYVVLVYGAIEADHDVIDFAIDRGKDGRMVARPKTKGLTLRTIGKTQPGKVAVTEFSVEKRFRRYTLLLVKTHTGRMHQIRVHLFAYNHPVAGDALYFNRRLQKKRDQELGRLFLHAERLCFEDLSRERKCFEAELPGELQRFLSELK